MKLHSHSSLQSVTCWATVRCRLLILVSMNFVLYERVLFDSDFILEKFTSFKKTLFSCTFGKDWDKKSKSGHNFGHLSERKKGLKFFFFQKRNFGIIFFYYYYNHIFQFWKIYMQDFQLRNLKKFKTVDFIFSFLKLKSSMFASNQKPTFAWPVSCSRHRTTKVSEFRIPNIYNKILFILFFAWSKVGPTVSSAIYNQLGMILVNKVL